MKTLSIIFGVLFVVLSASCQEEHHHIEQRVLENIPKPDITIISETNGTGNASYITDTTLPAAFEDSLTRLNSSAKLEQQLDSLKDTNPAQNTTTVAPNGFLEVNDVQEEPVTKFNVSSLLRANSSVEVPPNNSSLETTGLEAPKIFPNGTSLNGTEIIAWDTEKLSNLTSQKNSTNVEPGEEIPTDTKNETLVETKNETLAGTTNDTSVIDTEVTDLLNNTIQQGVPEKPVQIADNINDETELIENGQNTEDQLRNHHKLESDIDNEAASQNRYMAAILVSLLVAVSVLCYAAFVIWRRYLENRYGSRTMLVNAEEFDDPNDLRHFSI